MRLISIALALGLLGNAGARAGSDLASALEAIRSRHGLPALAAAAVRGTVVQERAAVGTRRLDAPDRVTIEDRWHVGSITKSMTATLAAMLVERGTVGWGTTVGASFPELRDTMEPLWAPVTLEQLLTHRAGAPASPPENLWANAWRARGPAPEQRLDFVRGLLLRRPESPPGSRFTYSNQGYAIAGTLLEKAAGESWEKLLRETVFAACGMKQAGFGPPATRGRTDAPWGHAAETGGLKPIAPGPEADNPAAIGPAGSVHCTIEELARYGAWHARGDRTGTPSLRRDAFTRLHTPPAGTDYAMGWIVMTRPWAGGRVLHHNGTNTMFYATLWVAPARDMAFAAVTNAGGGAAAAACDEAVAALLERVGLLAAAADAAAPARPGQ